MQAVAKPFLPVADYLAGELESPVKHEYIAGEVYAMAGTSDTHNVIAGNLYVALRQHLGTGPCKTYMADVKLRLEIRRDDLFYYPDVMVTCDPSDTERYYKTRPVFLAEVLSPATERIDRHEKLSNYTAIPSLQDYLLLSQHEPVATLFRRTEAWRPHHFTADDTLALPALGNLSLTVAALYAGVTFAPRA
jgi:Uma2 family endonuclease